MKHFLKSLTSISSQSHSKKYWIFIWIFVSSATNKHSDPTLIYVKKDIYVEMRIINNFVILVNF